MSKKSESLFRQFFYVYVLTLPGQAADLKKAEQAKSVKKEPKAKKRKAAGKAKSAAKDLMKGVFENLTVEDLKEEESEELQSDYGM